MSEQIVDPFFVVLNNGARIVQGAYPTSVFLEADSSWVGRAGAVEESAGYDWRLVFGIPAAPPRRAETVFIYSKDFKFTPPQLVHDIFLEDNPIALPLGMGIIQAAALKQQAGYGGAITATTVRWATTHPATTEPQFIFEDPADGVFVKVGTNTGMVTTIPITSA